MIDPIEPNTFLLSSVSNQSGNNLNIEIIALIVSIIFFIIIYFI